MFVFQFLRLEYILKSNMNTHLASWIQLAVCLIIYLPITIYNVHQLWIRKHQAYFAKRQPITLFILLLYLTLQYIKMVLSYTKHNCDVCLLPICHQISNKVVIISDTILLDGIYITMVLRVWLLYFNLHWSKKITNSEWHKRINKQATTNNVFLKYKSTLGSFNFMKWAALILYIFIVGVSAFIVAFDVSAFGKFNGAKLFVTVIFQVYILYKTPQNDVWKIKKELTMLLSIWCFAGLYFGVSVPLQLSDQFIEFAILSPYISFISCLTMTCVAVLYPIRQFEQGPDTLKLAKSPSVNMKDSWSGYVCKSNGHFERFMQHLQKEWSLENCLFIIEVMQFKDNNSTNNDDIGYYLQLPKDIPKSEIVYGENENIPVQQMFGLYDKYVKNGSDFELNISYKHRMDVITKISEATLNKDNFQFNVLIFDDCLMEISRLMNDSWHRYKTDRLHSYSISDMETKNGDVEGCEIMKNTDTRRSSEQLETIHEEIDMNIDSIYKLTTIKANNKMKLKNSASNKSISPESPDTPLMANLEFMKQQLSMHVEIELTDGVGTSQKTD
eukprot:174896_1